MKHIGILAVVSCLVAACGSPAREAEQVVRRTFGDVPDNVSFQLVEAPGQQYSLEVKDNTLYVEGSSPVALCKGFHDYILGEGLGVANWSGDRLDFPAKLEPMPRKTVVSPFDNHLFYNVCTYGYTSPFWGWEQWEHEIDWLALHGFDMPLAPVGTEAILSRVWKGIGLSQEEIDAYTLQNKNDQAQIKKLDSDPKAIKKIARERYFMKADNEDIFVLSDDENTSKILLNNDETAE